MSALIEVADAIDEMLKKEDGFYMGSSWIAATEVQGENGTEVIALASHDMLTELLEDQYQGEIPLRVFSATEINEFEVRQIAKVGTLLFCADDRGMQEWNRISDALSKASLDDQYAFEAWGRSFYKTFEPAPIAEKYVGLEGALDEYQLIEEMLKIADKLKRGEIGDSYAAKLVDEAIQKGWGR